LLRYERETPEDESPLLCDDARSFSPLTESFPMFPLCSGTSRRTGRLTIFRAIFPALEKALLNRLSGS
jgi:hypothetical protein